MSRALVVNQISLILDRQCNGCVIRRKLEIKHGKSYSKVDGHCNKLCQFGKELQDLGKLLGKGDR